MPPKKKQRVTISRALEVPAVQKGLDQWLQKVYDLRHASEEDARTTMPWPVNHGGTFVEVAGRAWHDVDQLYSAALRLCKKTGILPPDADLDAFAAQFCKMEAGQVGWAFGPVKLSFLQKGFSGDLLVKRPVSVLNNLTNIFYIHMKILTLDKNTFNQ